MNQLKYININTKYNFINLKEKDIFISNKLSHNYQKNPYYNFMETNNNLLNKNYSKLKEFLKEILKEITEIILFINAYLYIVLQINNKLHNINLNKFNLSSKAEILADNLYSNKIFSFLIKEIYIKTNDKYYFKIYPNFDLRINNIINDIYIRLYEFYPINNLLKVKEKYSLFVNQDNKNNLFNLYLFKILNSLNPKKKLLRYTNKPFF